MKADILHYTQLKNTKFKNTKFKTHSMTQLNHTAKNENIMRRSHFDLTQSLKPTPSLCRETYLFSYETNHDTWFSVSQLK